jgi:hypothetical protein
MLHIYSWCEYYEGRQAYEHGVPLLVGNGAGVIETLFISMCFCMFVPPPSMDVNKDVFHDINTGDKFAMNLDLYNDVSASLPSV